MDKLYFSPGACSLAVHAVLHRIGAPFQAIKIDTRKGEQRSPEYLSKSSRGRVPLLETEGRLVTEVIAIMLFLAERNLRLRLLPELAIDRALCISWMSHLQSTIHPFFGALWRTERFCEDVVGLEAVKTTAASRLRQEFIALDATLEHTPRLLGNDTYICDYTLFSLARWAPAVVDVTLELPNIDRFVRSMAEEPAVIRTLEAEDVPLYRKSL